MAGFTYQQYMGTSMGASGTDFLSDAPGAWGLPAAASFGTPLRPVYEMGVDVLTLARANYSYKDVIWQQSASVRMVRPLQ